MFSKNYKKVMTTTLNIYTVVTETTLQFDTKQYGSQKAATSATLGILVVNIR